MADAVELYRVWHDFEPYNKVIVDVPDPVPPVRLAGVCARIDYSSPKWEGDWVYYYHHIRRNHPLFAVDAAGNEFLVGYIDVAGNYRIVDGHKVSNGIDDWPRPQPKDLDLRMPDPDKGVTKLGVLEMVQFYDLNGKRVTNHYSDRFLVADPKADWCYMTKPHQEAARQGERENPLPPVERGRVEANPLPEWVAPAVLAGAIGGITAFGANAIFGICQRRRKNPEWRGDP